MEKSKIVKVNRLKLLKLKLLNEWRVLNFVKIVLNKVQNNKINEVLYKNIYANISILLSHVKLKNNNYANRFNLTHHK